MFYTGSTHADDGLVQRIGWATSPDLLTWTKATSPALEADGHVYEKLDLTSWHDEAWRDPFVFRADDGRWHMYVTARAGNGAARERGVIGHCTSQDLDHWVVQPPLTRPGSGFGQLEVPQVELVDGVPTLIFSCGREHLGDERRERDGDGGVYSVTGPSLLGPFDITAARCFPDDSIYAGRLVRHDDRWHLLGFRNLEDGEFVGELSDPITVTSEPGLGLTRLG